MTVRELLHDEGYKVIWFGTNLKDDPRGVVSKAVLRKSGYKFVTWSFDGSQFVDPVKIG